MASNDQMARHAQLVDRMAQARGVDLEEQVLRAKLAPDTLVDAVLSCTNCTNPADCAKWLDQADGTQDKTPGYCRNADLFETLLKGGSA